ncbi:MAG: HEAT repeat domain-containing protein [Planctomycetales bacterium]
MPHTRLLLNTCLIGLFLWAGSNLAVAQPPAAAEKNSPEKQSPEKQTAEKPSEEQIEQCRDKAMAYLLTNMAQGDLSYQAFVAMALLKSEHAGEVPEIQAVVDKILTRFSETDFNPTDEDKYSTCVFLITLANADREKYKPQVQMITDYLVREQEANGSWTYGPAHAYRGRGDVSITQFVVLALWDAARSGVKIPGKTWDKCAEWLVKFQLSDGAFSYHPLETDTTKEAMHSMTAAGVSSLMVIRLHLYPQSRVHFSPNGEVIPVVQQKKFGVLETTPSASANPVAAPDYTPRTSRTDIDRAISGGIRWLNKHYTLTDPTGWKIYYLYAIERLAAIGGMKQLGPHDWYNEGATVLVTKQNAKGSWIDAGWDTEGKLLLSGAGFAVMFLSKATAKIIDAQFGTGLLIGGRGLPDNLKDLQNNNGSVQVRKSKGSFDDLLAELEKPSSTHVEAVQTAIVDKILTERPQELIKQKDRMKKLARDPRPEVRLTAMWALGRTNDLTVAPVLIQGLKDPDESVGMEARNSLRILSRNLRGLKREIEDKFEPQQEYKVWMEWYRSIRPYNERDDLIRD